MMSNLSNRVQKSKSLKFNPVFHPHKIIYGTTSHNHEHHYQVTLSKTRAMIPANNKHIYHDAIIVTCTQCHQPVTDCPGNSNGTICYHGLGAIRHHLATKDCAINFCQNLQDALNLHNLGGALVRVTSSQGGAVLWGIVWKTEDKLAANVRAIRLSAEEAEGID